MTGNARPRQGEPGSGPGLWRLDARPDRLAGAADRWHRLAAAATVAEQRVRAATDELPASWRGESATAFRAHRDLMLGAAATLSTVGTAMADTLRQADGVLSTARDHLDDSWRRLNRAVPGLTFPAEGLTAAAGAALLTATAEATDIRAHADRRLFELGAELGRLRQRLGPANLTLFLEPDRAWSPPPELAEAGSVLFDGTRVIVDGSGGADAVSVAADPVTGAVVVTFAGAPPVVRWFPAGTEVVIRGGAGDDEVTVDGGVRTTVLAGAGDDVVHGGEAGGAYYGLWGRDTIIAGAGADYLSGGTGRDYLDGGAGDDELAGGGNDDVLYGLDGTDRLWGGLGADYLDGGAGYDQLAGDGDNDALFGGRGADTILGGAGDDRLYGGDGPDTIAGGPGLDDRAFAQPDDEVGGVDERTEVQLTEAGEFITVHGSADFEARVASDLDALRSSPDGAQMLSTLQQQHDEGTLTGPGDRLNITEYRAHNGYNHALDLPIGPSIDHIEYNPTMIDGAPAALAPPIVTLFHELAHTEDSFAGTSAGGTYPGTDNPGVPNREREAVGLPIDDDGDPATPPRTDPDHPWNLTENGLRQELGLAPRLTY